LEKALLELANWFAVCVQVKTPPKTPLMPPGLIRAFWQTLYTSRNKFKTHSQNN
jgi:hypothetical protein